VLFSLLERVWLYNPSCPWNHDSLLIRIQLILELELQILQLQYHAWLSFINFSIKKDLFCFLKQHHQFDWTFIIQQFKYYFVVP
jgi:hypothetical protein